MTQTIKDKQVTPYLAGEGRGCLGEKFSRRMGRPVKSAYYGEVSAKRALCGIIDFLWGDVRRFEYIHISRKLCFEDSPLLAK